MSEWNWVCKDEAFNDPECKWEIPFKRLDGEGNEIIISLEDVYPGYPECGQDLVMNIKPQHARLIAAAPELLEALKALVNEIRAYSSPECDDEGAVGASELKAADAAIAKAEPAP